jgi:hypothetical protein
MYILLKRKKAHPIESKKDTYVTGKKLNQLARIIIMVLSWMVMEKYFLMVRKIDP